MSGGALGSILRRLLPKLIKVASPILKNVVATLGLSAAMSGIDGAIQKNIYGSGTTTLVISNEELNDILKIVQALEDQNILLKAVTKTIKNDMNNKKGGALGMLLGTLGASLLGNLLSEKGLYRSGEGLYRTGQGIEKKALILPKHNKY